MKIESIEPKMIALGSTEKLRPIPWSGIGALPKRDYLIKGLIDKGGMSCMFGPSNCGKSFFALDLAITIARGIQWRGKRTRQGAVVYVAAEGGLGLVERLNAYAMRHDIIEKDVPIFVIPASIDLFGDEDADIILNHIQEMGIAPVAIWIDTLAASSGAANENLTSDMNQLIANVQKIRTTTKAHVQLVHHSGKDEARGARGSSALTAAVDTELEVFADADGNRTLNVKKQRDGIIVGVDFYFRLDVVDLGEDEDGDPVSSCIVIESDQGASRKKGKTGLAMKAKRGLESLQEAMIELGHKAPDNIHYPAGVQIVTETQWKDMCTRRGVFTTSNISQEWKRGIMTALHNAGAIAQYNDDIWIVRGY